MLTPPRRTKIGDASVNGQISNRWNATHLQHDDQSLEERAHSVYILTKLSSWSNQEDWSGKNSAETEELTEIRYPRPLRKRLSFPLFEAAPLLWIGSSLATMGAQILLLSHSLSLFWLESDNSKCGDENFARRLGHQYRYLSFFPAIYWFTCPLEM